MSLIQPTLILATRNRHKTGEIRTILGDRFCCRSLNDLTGAPSTTEDAPTFAGNAMKKAVELARWLSASSLPGLSREGSFVLADDSGLEVDALSGAPGVHSARFAAMDSAGSANTPDSDNNAKLLRLLNGIPPERRTARFRCVLALTPLIPLSSQNASPVCYADEFEMSTRLFEGVCEGRIDLAPSGNGGFGYDPLFVPDGFDRSFAELGEQVKNGLSHRARALGGLRRAFTQTA
jgi:XTP/dITP diphosphohydrolase